MSLRQILYFNYYKMASPETIDRTSVWRYESSEANFDAPEWATNQMENWLNALARADLQRLFENNHWVVTVNAEGVKNYLTDLSKMSYNDIWTHNGKNTIPQTMAIQIALEMKGIEVWKIDWILWNKTKKGIKEFQTKWNAEHPQDKITVDGVVWPATLQRLVAELNVSRNGIQRVWWAFQDLWRRIWRQWNSLFH